MSDCSLESRSHFGREDELKILKYNIPFSAKKSGFCIEFLQKAHRLTFLLDP